MKLSILVLAISIFSSCSRRDSSHNNNTPAALETTKSSSVFKRVPGELVQDIYNEIVSETPELKELENQIRDINDRKRDSLSDYEKFSERNDEYYRSADRHLEMIKDSVLKEKIKTLINNSESSYKNATGSLNDLVIQLDTKQTTLNDYHELLKLTRTLPVIAKFQKENLPSKGPIAAIVNDYDRLIGKTDSLSKGN